MSEPKPSDVFTLQVNRAQIKFLLGALERPWPYYEDKQIMLRSLTDYFRLKLEEPPDA